MIYTLIYDVIKIDDLKYKAHYRLYDDERTLITTDDYIYTIKKPRRMTPGTLKGKITTGIHHSLVHKGTIDDKDRFKSTCLVTNNVIKKEIGETKKAPVPEIKKEFEKKVEVDNNPRIYRVVLINGNYTIVKAETQYLTREQAKEELFNRQLEEA